jgi:hypothetical protein
VAGPIAANNTIRITEGSDRVEDVYADRGRTITGSPQLELA